MRHAIHYDVENYGGSSFARKISYRCAGCGAHGTLTDGRVAPTRKRAKAAHDRKAASERAR